MANEESSGLTRRETLKRGLKLTGAVMWATPVVQAIGMSPALAQTVSPPDCLNEECSLAKWDTRTRAFEDDPGNFECAVCPGDGVDGTDVFNVSIQLNDEDEVEQVTLTLTNPDECRITAIHAKAGQACIVGQVSSDGNSATVSNIGGQEISHVEVCFCCCVED